MRVKLSVLNVWFLLCRYSGFFEEQMLLEYDYSLKSILWREVEMSADL